MEVDMNLDEFEGVYKGQSIDYDQAFGPQCVDLIKLYAVQVVGSPIPTGDAWEYNRNQYPTHYDYHKNTLLYIPPKGAIAVWNKNVGYGYGHVAIVLSAGLMSFTSLDQNWLKNPIVQEVTHKYTNVDSFLVPKNTAQSLKYNQLVSELTALVKKYPTV